ncbi:MAG: DoxX family protein [Verrucomicrobiae bacterium]|nr:DoxX family protein [Verrucomicrobiae bacterium]
MNPPRRIGLPDFYLLLLRLVFALPLFYYQIRQQTVWAWKFLWEQKDWPLLNAMSEMGLPQPSVTAVGLTFILLASPFGILIGFFTRVNAALTLLALIFFFLSDLPFSDWLNGQTYVLYLGITAVLIIGGSGSFSFDGLFAMIRRRKKALRVKAAL